MYEETDQLTTAFDTNTTGFGSVRIATFKTSFSLGQTRLKFLASMS